MPPLFFIREPHLQAAELAAARARSAPSLSLLIGAVRQGGPIVLFLASASLRYLGTGMIFSYFALFAQLAADINSARAYPVPWRPGSGGKFDSPAGTYGMVFDNLADRTEIRIFTITGRLVRELKVTAADLGFKVWDGRNASGLKAASGVYLAHIKSGSHIKILKIAVER